MNTKSDNNLISYYKKGNTSCQEEEYLIENNIEGQTSDRIWFAFLKKHRLKSPVDLESDIASIIIRKSRSRRRTLVSALAAAACISLLLSTILIKNSRQSYMEYIDNTVGLLEARSLFSYEEAEHTEKEIIYEDETILIYMK